MIKYVEPTGYQWMVFENKQIVAIDDDRLYISWGIGLTVLSYRTYEDGEIEAREWEGVEDYAQDAKNIIDFYIPSCMYDVLTELIFDYVGFQTQYETMESYRYFESSFVKELRDSGENKQLKDQPWIQTLYDNIPLLKLKVEKKDDVYQDYNPDVSVTWVEWMKHKIYRYDTEITQYTPQLLQFTNWGGYLYTITDKDNNLLGYYYDSSCSLQVGDSHTVVYLLDDNHLAIGNHGDVSSVVVLAKYEHGIIDNMFY